MPDHRFFKKSGHYTAGEIADSLGCQISDQSRRSLLLEDLAALKAAGQSDLSFFDNAKYKRDFKSTRAGACFVSPEMASLAPPETVCLITPKPYRAYALAAQKFYPENKPQAGSIAPTAFVHPSAKLGEGCVVEHGAFIDAGVEIGDHTLIEVNAVIRENVMIGIGCRIGANATVSHALIGDDVRLYPGVRVGQDGFGFAIDPTGHVKVPQLGRVIIGDHVEIGANTTIDRGAGPDTVIGGGTWIDNLVQIGHNVVIGKGCVIVAQVGISGSTVLEDFVALGGQVGIAGHLRIGMGTQVAAQSGVIADIPAGERHMGSPSFPQMQYLRRIVALNNLINKKKSG